MVDLTPTTIKMIFEERVRELTRQTPIPMQREDYAQKRLSADWSRFWHAENPALLDFSPDFHHFDYQYSGRWLE